jgi:hypothetical protein
MRSERRVMRTSGDRQGPIRRRLKDVRGLPLERGQQHPDQLSGEVGDPGVEQMQW